MHFHWRVMEYQKLLQVVQLHVKMSAYERFELCCTLLEINYECKNIFNYVISLHNLSLPSYIFQKQLFLFLLDICIVNFIIIILFYLGMPVSSIYSHSFSVIIRSRTVTTIYQKKIIIILYSNNYNSAALKKTGSKI